MIIAVIRVKEEQWGTQTKQKHWHLSAGLQLNAATRTEHPNPPNAQGETFHSCL